MLLGYMCGYLVRASNLGLNCWWPLVPTKIGQIELFCRSKCLEYKQKQHKLMFPVENSPAHHTRAARILVAPCVSELLTHKD